MVVKMIAIEVAYAGVSKQTVIPLKVEEGTTILSAIQQSGILTLFPEIDLATQKVGIFSKPKELSDLVHENERIELYRHLLIDPKEARRKRSKK